MKAITTLAVLGLAFAGERRENPRFRIDHRVINADNNSGVKVVEFSKDFQNTNTTQGATEEDWMKYVPKELRGLVNTGTVDSKVFTARNNTGTVIIRRDDADDEFGLIDVHNKITNIDANHNSGMMKILNRDEADDEFGLIDIHNKITNIDANHNSGMMKILNRDEADDEFTIRPPFHINPDVVYRDDEFAAWNLLETYGQSNQQLGPHTVHSTTRTQTFNAPNNNQGVVIIRDDAADDELGLINIHHEIRNINANHNSGMMTILDDADNELGLINIHHEIRNIDANHNSGMMTILDDADDELAVLGSLLRKDWTH